MLVVAAVVSGNYYNESVSVSCMSFQFIDKTNKKI